MFFRLCFVSSVFVSQQESQAQRACSLALVTSSAVNSLALLLPAFGLALVAFGLAVHFLAPFFALTAFGTVFPLAFRAPLVGHPTAFPGTLVQRGACGGGRFEVSTLVTTAAPCRRALVLPFFGKLAFRQVCIKGTVF